MIALKASLIAVSSLLALVQAAPGLSVRDSSVNEPAVSSPDGTPVTLVDTPAATPQGSDNSNSNSYGGSSGGSSYGGSSGGSYGGSSDNSGSYGSSNNGGSYGGSSGGSYGGSSNNNYGGNSNNGGSYGGSSNNYGGNSNNGGSYGGSSNYGGNSYSSSANNYGGNSYSSSANNYNYGGNNYQTSSTMMEPSTTQMYEPPMMTEASTSAYVPPPMPSYGSGSNSWGNNGYDDCVSKCMATYGAPPSMYTPPASYNSPPSSGSGKVWKVTVAPHQGVLRYVPFAINASVGDTIRFIWGAGPHTVTKSSILEPCNKTSDKPFASGTQQQSFIFEQVVNDTNPTMFYCGVPGHCEKGMFGIINPPSAGGSMSSAGMMMPMAAQNSSDMAAQMSYTMQQCQGNDDASNWGSSMDMSKLMPSSGSDMTNYYQNIMFTRLMMAANKDAVTNGVFNPTSDAPFQVPGDISVISANSAAASPVGAAAASGSSSGTVSGATSAASSASSAKPTSPAMRSSVASTGVVAFAALAAAFFAL